MDPFVGFAMVVLDASDAGPKARVVSKDVQHRERVDLISRQFHDFLLSGDQADTTPHGMVLTSEFRVRRQVSETAGWLAFMVDRGDGKDEKLEEVAMVVFAQGGDAAGREAMKRVERFLHLSELPDAPVVVAVKLVSAVPAIVSEWFGKAVAGFFVEAGSSRRD